MDSESLITAFVLDSSGGGKEIDWEAVRGWTPAQGILWVHLNYSAPECQRWIKEESGLSELTAEALLSEETRPRTTLMEEGVLLALRGVNLNPDADPEDMVSVRVLASENRLISTRQRPLMSATDIARILKKGIGPRDSGEFLVELIDRLTQRMEPTIEEAEDRVAQLEEDMMAMKHEGLRSALAEVRRSAITLRRYMAPQREAMTRLAMEKIAWFTNAHRLHLREATDRLIRHIEDLDAIRDRAAITQEELSNRHSEQMNERMYVLSLVAAIFLPLGFLTGLLGVNVGGIPGAEYKWAFLLFLLILALVILLQMLYFKKRKWL